MTFLSMKKNGASTKKTQKAHRPIMGTKNDAKSKAKKIERK